MSRWKIAAAQYEPLKTSVREHIIHHLKFIDAAARQQCELLVFPSLSLLGCVDGSQSLPAPPDISLLKPTLTGRPRAPYDDHCRSSGQT